MFGKILSTGIKIVTLPVKAANAAADVVTGGDGSKRSRMAKDPMMPQPLRAAEQLGDAVADAAADIDE